LVFDLARHKCLLAGVLYRRPDVKAPLATVGNYETVVEIGGRANLDRQVRKLLHEVFAFQLEISAVNVCREDLDRDVFSLPRLLSISNNVRSIWLSCMDISRFAWLIMDLMAE
jgi:hypothetical protein